MLQLFVTFPQSILPKPSDGISVIRSMMRAVDASFRRGCGSVIIQGAGEFISFLGLKKRWGDLACFFGSGVQSFPCEGSTGRGKADAQAVAKFTTGITNYTPI